MRQPLLHECKLNAIHPHAVYCHSTSVIEIRMRTLREEIGFQKAVFKFFENFIFSNPGDSSKALNNIQIVAEADPIKEAAEDRNCSLYILKHVILVFNKRGFLDPELRETLYLEADVDLKDFCLEMFNGFLHGCSRREYTTSSFISVILLLLKVLVISKPNAIAPVKDEMRSLEKMLEFVFTISLVAENTKDEKLQNFVEHIQPWVNSAATVPFVFWVDEMDEKLCVLLSSFLRKFYPSTPELVEVYLGAAKHLKPSREVPDSEVRLMRNALLRFIDILLENLVASTDDRFVLLSETLLFLIVFLMHPPQAYAEHEKLILTETNLLVGEAASLICSLCLGELRGDIADGRNILLHDLLEKINRAKAELRPLYVEIPGLSWNNAPQTNRQGFFDFLLGNLRKKLEAPEDLFPFEKHLITTVQKELESLRPFLMDIFVLQEEHEELKDIWVRAGNVAYLVDHVTDSCLTIYVPIWSNLMHLSNATEQIQFVKTEVTKIRENQIYNSKVISAKINSKLVLPQQEQANATTTDDVKVGFADEEDRIIDRLTGGKVNLDMVAIVGMPGQGKTTLAQRVFHDPRVQFHFNKCAWCCISHAYDIKEVLLDILKAVDKPVPNEQVPSVSYKDLAEEDLADRLRKCLKGQKYLVVLDDIWDVKAWYELQLSFPDDSNRSRILLTSRYRNVALEAEPDCYAVELHPLPFEESWKLLQMKLFGKDGCPQILLDIGKTIAENCKGLPLAIVLVAGLLKKDKNVDSWKQIAESLKSQIASEGCMNILELSYQHLPNFLKPCFLYLGEFQEDQIIDAKKLIQLWIAEGFVQSDGMKSLEVVANEYLIDLVARSLVFVAKRSSRYGIKKCRVHDLLHELCLMKAKEERFFLVPNLSDNYSITRYAPYRLCVHDERAASFDSKPIVLSVRSLLGPGNLLYKRYYPDAPSFFSWFRLLRVLDLHSCDFDSGFDQITQLIHLRFLSIPCGTILNHIPPSIVNLFRLEVLRFGNESRVVHLPHIVMKMANLRHIFVSRCKLHFDEELKLLPPLTNLETFTYWKLGLVASSTVWLSRYFNKLESLNLQIEGKYEHVSPSTFNSFPSTLKKLKLKSDKPLTGNMMSSIAKLSNLEVLKLEDGRLENPRWDVEDDEFLNLKYLKLSYIDIIEWNASDESFPCLQQLVIKRCIRLTELPCRFGAMPTLKRIELRKCSDSLKSSFQQIVDDQRDFGNEGLRFSSSYLSSKFWEFLK